ncbi:Uma2 family endonuclease [Dolichospermum lemmermannii CS-548]|uniref:Uma2 family endonuclease n=1 Tax=Dolichospermum lemmermannii TaxID=54295 RepID=UPI00232F5E89|nr:Uma2 family endonuclease [Dolichospermum lemmermannii]MDB9438225.1 Uma2 family endonuclease [Dolichospermum lemmermannii CS-548]
MSQVYEGVRWTITDLELLPDNGNHYEIINGELFVTRAPHWKHQKACNNICTELTLWSRKTGLGEAVTTPGIVFTDADNVIPDVVWISNQRLATLLDNDGHLTGAPELVIEVLSAGGENERRDKEVKLKLYASRGVQEYWIIDWRLQQVEIYQREKATLILVKTLFTNDELTSPLFPDFVCIVGSLFV